jgi:PPOX class probable FMN-dependent enzyme
MSTATDPHRITTVEQLRTIIGAPHELAPHKLWQNLDESCLEFIKRSPFLLLATADTEDNLDVSPKGDGPGFVAVEDETTLLIPDRKGNKLIFGLQNILTNPHVGLIFLIPGTDETLRVNGTAEITADPAILERLSARGQPAVVAIRVKVREVFYHCAKAFIRSQLWRPESWSERHKISFGKIFSGKLGGDNKLAEQIDKLVEEDYRTNL